jgi:hypothetical protein
VTEIVSLFLSLSAVAGMPGSATVPAGSTGRGPVLPASLPEDFPRTTETKRGKPGDPLNVALAGRPHEIAHALEAAGWVPADRRTVLRMVRSGAAFLLGRPYRHMPVSNLYLYGRRQDFAYEKPAGRTVRRRHHVRLWRSSLRLDDGRPIYIGAATYDMGLHPTDFMHRISPDVDKERDMIVDDLAGAGQAAAMARHPGLGAVSNGRNGEGDPYFTDGHIIFVALNRIELKDQARPDAGPSAGKGDLRRLPPAR